MAITLTWQEQRELDNSLLTAVFNGDLVAIEQALTAGAKPDGRNIDQSTSLIYAANNGNSDVIKALLEAGADVNAYNNNKDTALHFAAKEGHSDVAKILIVAGANLDLINRQDETPIETAQRQGHQRLAFDMQSIAFAATQPPTPESVGLDMKKRNAALAALARGEKPVVGKHIAAVNVDRQRQAALDDPTQGI